MKRSFIFLFIVPKLSMGVYTVTEPFKIFIFPEHILHLNCIQLLNASPFGKVMLSFIGLKGLRDWMGGGEIFRALSGQYKISIIKYFSFFFFSNIMFMSQEVQNLFLLKPSWNLQWKYINCKKSWVKVMKGKN